jgi:glycosyltransferase involved in cell wall biosynthesis
MEDLPKRVAIVYDRVNKFGGAERVLLALHDIFPDAPLFTAVYSPSQSGWARVFPEIIPSFLNKVPFFRNRHELVPFLTPIAFESFNFRHFDAVISVTSTEAKGIITPPEVFHLCYCLTPTRYLYSHESEYKNQLGLVGQKLSRPIFSYLKYWDQIAKHRPDSFVSISQTVQARIKKYYGLDSAIVYPPVDVKKFTLPKTNNQSLITNYYLWVGRFVSYKHPDLVVKAFNHTGQKLIMVGESRMNWGLSSLSSRLKKMAKPNITFRENVPDSELADLYGGCLGLVFFHEEDFGITAVEAMAAGKPVIGINSGGVSETVVSGQTGVLSADNTLRGLIKVLQTFDPAGYNPRTIRNRAQKFSRERFRPEFVKVFTQAWHKYQTIHMS